MAILPDALSKLYEKYAAVDAARGDSRYRSAIESLVNFYLRIGNDSATLEDAIDALIEDYEDKQEQMVSFLQMQDFLGIEKVVRELKSSIRNVVDESVLENVREIERASMAKDLPRTYGAWSNLHEKLCPLFLVMRQLRRQ